MKTRLINISVLIALLCILFASCRDDSYLNSEDAKLAFSVDTLKFDTIFTTIGSTTKSFRVINPHNRQVLISTIQLAGGDRSSYRLNIDGVMTNELHDVELAANDSIFIFVGLTVDPNGVNQPMIVQDSILFVTNSNTQDIDLIAWGQDFIPIDNEVLSTTTWTAEKPYLIYNIVWVDSGAVLNIEPGARIYFHKNAAMGVLGSIQATGTPQRPITFSGDRLEAMYDDIPDQWSGIVLFPDDQLNVFENVTIKNASIGLQVGTIEYEGAAHVRLHNVKIEHMSYAGIFAIKSNIEATNTLVADCGFYAVTLLVGGSYDFNHCTIANYWSSFSNRQTPSLLMSNKLSIPQGKNTLHFTGDMVQANWRNSIIWGNLDSEIEFGNDERFQFNFNFENCLFRLKDSTYNVHSGNFESSIINKDPLFVKYNEYNYEPDSLSPAINKGSIEYGKLVPFDLNNFSRLSDSAPDIGAYEWIKKDEE